MFKNLTIKAKLITITLISLVILSAILGIVSVKEAKDSLMQKSYATLTSARDNKAQQLKNFFAERIGDINVLSSSNDIEELVYDLTSLDGQLDIDNDGRFPVEEMLVQDLTKNHEPFFQKYMKEYGYYDIFLIDAHTGHVLYTAAKESDYGANLKTGPLAKSGLGEVFSKTLQNKKATFVDMKPYAPSNGAPAMFLGTPIFEDGEIITVLVFQVSDGSINKIMQFRKGYGDSQEDYLVGSDYLMRSDSFLDPKGHSLKASFANPQKGQAKTEASINALQGKTATQIVTDYNGNPVLSAYGTIKIGDDITWAILSEIDESEVLIVPNYIRNVIAIITIVLLIIIGIIVYIIINKGIIKPLENFQEGLLGFFKYLNRENEDVKLLESTTNDEIGIMSNVVNENIEKTKIGIDEDRKLIDNTISVLAEFEQGDLRQRVNASSNNAALNELTRLLNQMGSNLEKNIDGILSVLEEYSNYNYMNKVSTEGIKEHLLKLANGVNSLGDSTTQMLIENKRIGLTLDGSSDVLLSNVDTLNTNSNETAASLEETAAALEEITSTIRNNTGSVSQMASYAHELTDAANEGENMATKTTSAMDDINEQVTAINDSIGVIDQIAFQTNILSLNAAVEAATAGEAGKGFAVVAQEVRNLASRSAEAAKEIKDIVETATSKANEGKTISDSMISGYTKLNENIAKTLQLINDVDSSSKEQLNGIEQINDAVTQLDRQTQENVAISNTTHEIAMSTDKIAKEIVNEANAKEFKGKNDIKVETEYSKTNVQKTPIVNVPKNEHKEVISEPINKPHEPQIKKVTSDNTQDSDEWESF